MKLQKFLSLFPAIVLLAMFVGTSASFAVAPEDFVNPPSNYEPMNIYILNFNFKGYSPLKGDKVGVFNEKASGDTLCVGVTELKDKNFADYAAPNYFRVIAYREEKDNGVIIDAGFTPNDTLKFYLWVKETNQVTAIPSNVVTYLNTKTGEPLENPVLFDGRGTALVSIESPESTLSLSVNPAGVGETIPKSDDYVFTDPDTIVTIQVDPAKTLQHYSFSHWTVDGVMDASAELHLQMNENHTVVANFVKKTIYACSSLSASRCG